MYDLGELIGRYILTGMILYGALLLMLIVRLVWVAFKPGNGGVEFIQSCNSYDRNGKKRGKRKVDYLRTAVEWIFYPYGLVRAVDRYMKMEKTAICRVRELQENTKS